VEQNADLMVSKSLISSIGAAVSATSWYNCSGFTTVSTHSISAAAATNSTHLELWRCWRY